MKRPGRIRQILKVLRKNKLVYGITPVKLRKTLEDLGPTFIKFGQIFSMRTDLLPLSYIEELVKLRTDVVPMEYDVIKSELEKQLGKYLNEVFASIEETPLGSASISQVHRATLLNGDKVVLKVQRPNIYQVMEEDINLLKKASSILGILRISETIDFVQVLDEMWKTTKEELDFTKELENILKFEENNKDIEYIGFPKVYPEYSNSYLLVMEEIVGFPIDDKAGLIADGYDLDDIGNKIATNYIKQVIDDGYFHADPHQGNIMIRDNKIIWIDLGMIGRIDKTTKQLLKRIIKAIVLNDVGDIESAICVIGKPSRKIDHTLLYNDIDDFLSRYAHTSLESIDIAVFMNQFLGLARGHDIAIPAALTMLARGIATIEGVVMDLFPEVDFMELITARAKQLILEDFDIKQHFEKLGISAYNLFDKTIDIPVQIFEVLRMANKGQARANIDATINSSNIDRFDKMITKLAIALIIAGSIVGSSMLCTTNMDPKLLGIPIVGIIGYFITFLLGLSLIFMLFKDYFHNRRK